jgi:hypothetical protein
MQSFLGCLNFILKTSVSQPKKLWCSFVYVWFIRSNWPRAIEQLQPDKLETLPTVQSIAPFPVLQRTLQTYFMMFDERLYDTERLCTYGVVIWRLPDRKIEHTFNGLVSNATNNVTEYYGYIEGLKMALQTHIPDHFVLGDSQLR